MKKVLIGAIVSVSLSTGAIASEPQLANDELTNKMRSIFKGTPVNSATHIPGIPGMVEMIVANNKIIYTSETGDLVFVGHLYDRKTNTDITQAKINELSKVDFKNLPFQNSFTIRKGNGSREFAVFTDVDCPYCRKLEQELAQLDDYTMHVFLFPLNMHKDAKRKSEAIWCSQDKGNSFRTYMATGSLQTDNTSCDTSAIQKNVRFGFDNGISGTPNLIAKNGMVKPGFMPAQQLNSWLNKNGR